MVPLSLHICWKTSSGSYLCGLNWLCFDASECLTHVMHVQSDEQNIKTEITCVPTRAGFWMEFAWSMSGRFNLKVCRTSENRFQACLHFCGVYRSLTDIMQFSILTANQSGTRLWNRLRKGFLWKKQTTYVNYWYWITANVFRLMTNVRKDSQ